MHRNRVAAVLAIAAFAGALVAGGCVSAATKPPAAAATASGRAAAAAGGTANIMIYAVNTDGAYWHAIMSGVIGDYGPAVSIYPGGQVDPLHNSQMDLRLTQGSFRLGIAALDKAFVKAASHEPIYPKTCTDLISVTGTTRIVAGSGTGAYRGIRGSFPVTLTLHEVEARPCQPSPGAFRAQLITVAGPGTIWFSGIRTGKVSRAGSHVPRRRRSGQRAARRHRSAAEASRRVAEPPTGRELEVLRLPAAGKSNQRTARDLVMALDTVRNT